MQLCITCLTQVYVTLQVCITKQVCPHVLPSLYNSHKQSKHTYSEGATNCMRSIQVILAGTANMQIISLRLTPSAKDVISLVWNSIK